MVIPIGVWHFLLSRITLNIAVATPAALLTYGLLVWLLQYRWFIIRYDCRISKCILRLLESLSWFLLRLCTTRCLYLLLKFDLLFHLFGNHFIIREALSTEQTVDSSSCIQSNKIVTIMQLSVAITFDILLLLFIGIVIIIVWYSTVLFSAFIDICKHLLDIF